MPAIELGDRAIELAYARAPDGDRAVLTEGVVALTRYLKTSGMRRTTVVSALLALTLAAGGGAAQAKPTYPVPHGYPDGVAAQLTHPGQAPPGANDMSCKPSREHPNPVVLLNGFASTDTLAWQTLSPLLANDGYCVFSTTIGKTTFGDYGGFASVQDSAREVDAFVTRVREANSAAKVDIVAHSVGGAVGFWYLSELGGAQSVRNLVSLGTPFHGSDLDGMASLLTITGAAEGLSRVCAQCRQLAAASPFLAELNPDPARIPDVHFTDIVSRYDEIATPYLTGLLSDGPNVRNEVLQDRCATDYADHLQLPYDPVAIEVVQEALNPGRGERAVCPVVLPAPVGTVS
ncbi:esterase/lipase family protein [Prescottella soli]|uniref:esterase/lipase family protein n=1 Tax=Prescottella soli TaxID=1543852 RepID=UPI0038BA97AC